MTMFGEDHKDTPQFFKILMGSFMEKLPIPHLFAHRYLKEIRDFATVMSPLRRFWHIRIRKDVQHLYFDDGWKEFCLLHDLQEGFFLVFRYEGNSVFSVKVFELSGCLKSYNVVEHQHTHCTINQRENGTPDVSENQDVPVKSPCVKQKQNMVDLDSDEEDVKPTSEMLQNVMKKPIRRKSSQVDNKKSSKDLTSIKRPKVQNEKIGKDITQRKSPLLQRKIFADDLRNWESPQVPKENLLENLVQQNSSQTLNQNVVKDPASLQHTVTSLPTESKPSDVNVTGHPTESEPIDVKPQIMVHTIPLRRTGRHKPRFETILKASNISRKQLFIPPSFCISSGWEKKQIVVLQDARGRSWNVEFTTYAGQGQFSGEWHDFCAANNLQCGDKCVFVLIAKGILSVQVVRRTSTIEEAITIDD